MQKQQTDIQSRDNQIIEMNEEIRKLQYELHILRKNIADNDDDSDIKVVEMKNGVDSSPKNTLENSCSVDFIKRYEELLDENRNLRKLLDDLNTDPTANTVMM